MDAERQTRLDQRLVELGLAESRARAQALIRAGAVTVEGAPAAKPSQKVGAAAVEVTGDPCPWVSRAALKLAHALDVFDLAPSGVALDVGAS
ncbi:MAG: S4 domain-containing protein, partial [Pseudomonadota bacterium]